MNQLVGAPTVNVQQGELVVDALTLVNPEKQSIDLTAICSNITIFEDIQKSFLTGHLTLIDGLDILKNYKVVGQESLTLKIRQAEGRGEYSIPDDSIDKVFRIYGVSNVQRPHQNTQTYVIHFIDPKFFTCQKTTVSQTLRGSYSGMLLKVLEEYAGFKQLTKTAYAWWDESEPEYNQFIIPNWNINQFIKYVCNNAELKGNKTFKNSMFFYQTLNDEFRFDSFQSMTAREYPIRFSHMPRNAKIASELDDVNEDNEGKNSQILELHVPQRFNTIRGLMGGAYSSKMLTYDPVRKLEEENVYSISKVFERGNEGGHVSQYPLIRTSDMETTYRAEEVISTEESPDFNEEFVDLAPDASYDSKRVYRVNMTNSFSDEAKLIDATDDKAITQQKGQEYRDTGLLERTALLSLFEQSQIRVKIPFRSDITVGTIIHLDIPTSEKKTDSMPGDEMMDGRYLIVKITYVISPLDGMGILKLTAIKESYGVDIKEYEPLAKDTVGPEKA